MHIKLQNNSAGNIFFAPFVDGFAENSNFTAYHQPII
jgi:hypothetical protein